jgi:hypothetical protein
MTKDIKHLNNVQIIVLALYVAGAKTKRIHLEDIAICADKIIPGAFRWEKYRKFISDRIVLNSLSDATKEKNGSLASGSMKQGGWILTPEGIRFSQKHLKLLGKNKTNKETRNSPELKSWIRHERVRLLHEEAYSKFIKGGLTAVSIKENESFFRLNEYITGVARKEQIQLLQNLFRDDAELKIAVIKLGNNLLEKTNG